MPHLSELERKALELIESKGDEGLYQSELWKILGIDSREGSRIALQLLKKGLIRREPVINNGRRTYKLYVIRRTKLNLRVNLANVIDIPCFTCLNIDKCSNGGFFDPRTCRLLTEWLINQVNTRNKRT